MKGAEYVTSSMEDHYSEVTLHYTTLHYTTLHYTTLNYTTLHYITTSQDYNRVSESIKLSIEREVT